MTDVTALRTLLQEEESDYLSALGENLFFRQNGSINFNLIRQHSRIQWHLNGRLSSFSTARLGPFLDGPKYCPFDMEIVGFMYSVGLVNPVTTPSSVVFDIHRLSDGGATDNGSIFSTLPEIDDTASDARFLEFRPGGQTVPTGYTLAVLSTTQLNEGDALRLDLDQQPGGFRTLNVELIVRPR